MKALFDSNVLIYSMDNADPCKRDAAQALMQHHMQKGTFVVTPQVMLEFFNIMTRKFGSPPADVLQALRVLATREVTTANADFALRAATLATDHRLSTWDAAVIQSGMDAGCDVLFSEDLQSGRRFGSLEIVNPFLQGVHETVIAPRTRPRRPVASRSQRL